MTYLSTKYRRTTVSGGVVTGTVNGYLIGASGGQQMAITLVSPNAVWELYAPDDTFLDFQLGVGPGDPGWILTLPSNGDYLLVISSNGGNASYDLTVEIF